MQVIATAGHVDHGKSTLVQALTGIDPDRLEEEKRRGLTIDLGFAWMRLPSGNEVGIVDVPGHERFIKNMLAGVGATRLVLFVVAANEGWERQSQEHLDIIDLLGIDQGVVVITKADTVESVADVAGDIGRRVAGTGLGSAPILPVSARTGEGIESLRGAIAQMVGSAGPSPDIGRPRLWVDRTFTIKGSGTVVTGTLIEGSLAVDDQVEIFPKGLRARIRSIQSHRSRLDRIRPGSRAALNLAGLTPGEIERGDVIGKPGSWSPTTSLVGEVRLLDLGFQPSEKGAFKLYLGSSELDVTLRFIGPPPISGGRALARFDLTLQERAVASFGDGFILRDSGRRVTLGGGRVIEPVSERLGPPRSHTALERAEARARCRSALDYLEVLLEEGPLRHSEARMIAGSTELPSTESTKNFLVSREHMARIRADILQQVTRYHAEHPLEPGIPRPYLNIDLDPRVTEEALTLLIEEGSLVADEEFLRNQAHRPAIDTGAAAEVLKAVDEGAFAPPTLPELQARFDHSLIRSLVRAGRLVQVDRDIVFTPERMGEITGILAKLVEEEGPFTVARFRDALGTTRKYAVPILEYLDSKRITQRQGDLRTITPPHPSRPEARPDSEGAIP